MTVPRGLSLIVSSTGAASLMARLRQTPTNLYVLDDVFINGADRGL